MNLSKSDFNAIRAKAKARKDKRAVRVADNRAIFTTATPIPDEVRDIYREQPKKKRRKPSARKQAFARLKASCTLFVLLRAKQRTGGLCEVKVICGGENPATLAYHIQPAATGNAVKYDVRNLVGACSSCNGGEYFDRKRGTYDRWTARHKELQGQEVYELIKALAGRKQISTVEANEMNEALRLRVERGHFA